MASRSLNPVAMQWQRTGPNARLLIGVIMIVSIMLIGQSPRFVFGIEIAWPYAALAGGIGWARVGLSIRPMLALALLGLLQDILSMAPLGCFMIVNLVTYGLHAGAADSLDTERDPVLGQLLPHVSLLAGFIAVWIIASGLADTAVPLLPLMLSWLTTSLVYILIQPILDLDRRPGEFAGGG